MMEDYGAMMAVLGPVMAVAGIMVVIVIVSMWKIYTKANRPGWAAIVPIYNTIVLLDIVRKPWWWLLLMFIPYVGVIWAIWAINLLAKSFGKGPGFTVGILFLPMIFLPILAFDGSEYEDPDGGSEFEY